MSLTSKLAIGTAALSGFLYNGCNEEAKAYAFEGEKIEWSPLFLVDDTPKSEMSCDEKINMVMQIYDKKFAKTEREYRQMATNLITNGLEIIGLTLTGALGLGFYMGRRSNRQRKGNVNEFLLRRYHNVDDFERK